MAVRFQTRKRLSQLGKAFWRHRPTVDGSLAFAQQPCSDRMQQCRIRVAGRELPPGRKHSVQLLAHEVEPHVMKASSGVRDVDGRLRKRQLLANSKDGKKVVLHAPFGRKAGGVQSLVEHGSHEDRMTGTREQHLHRVRPAAADLKRPLARDRRQVGVSLELGKGVVGRVDPDAGGVRECGSEGRDLAPVQRQGAHGGVGQAARRIVVEVHLLVSFGVFRHREIHCLVSARNVGRHEPFGAQQHRNPLDDRIRRGTVLHEESRGVNVPARAHRLGRTGTSRQRNPVGAAFGECQRLPRHGTSEKVGQGQKVGQGRTASCHNFATGFRNGTSSPPRSPFLAHAWATSKFPLTIRELFPPTAIFTTTLSR